MQRQLGKYEKIFIRITEEYVKFYKERSFEFTFDNFKSPRIGSGKKTVKVQFKNSEKTFKRIFTEGSLGLGESYCEGNIIVKDQDYKWLLYILVKSSSRKKIILKLPISYIFTILKARFSGPSTARENQHENINSHYSLSDWFKNEEDSNKFYLYWLNSKYIQYTCAKWDKNIKTLEQAQRNKFEFYAKRLGITKKSKGKTLLDLGCGWGGLMFYMAEKFGVNCTGVTLSKSQAKYIEKEAKKRGLSNKVKVELKNMHDVRGKYDHVISVGSLEHIDDYKDLYKENALHLKEGGSLLHHSMFHTRRIYKPDPFLLKYIFPGGGTPYLKETMSILRKYFSYVDRKNLPDMSYPKTLQCWFNNFIKNEKKIRNLLKTRGKVKDIDFAIRIFKHYLMLAHVGLAVNGLVANILAKKPKIR